MGSDIVLPMYLMSMSRKDSTFGGAFPGTHAEVRAVNDLIDLVDDPTDISVGTSTQLGTRPSLLASPATVSLATSASFQSLHS